MDIIKLTKIRQTFARDKIDDVQAAVHREFEGLDIEIKVGSRIALAVGSRGISEISSVIRAVIEFVQSNGANPFIVPAMGSHGGATAEGQIELLESYGITGEAMGVPIESSMEVVELPNGDLESRVYMDKKAYESDGVILINRIKPHTDYHGPFESGLVKMAVIGLGKHAQALEMHQRGVYGLKELMPPTCAKILEAGKIIAGLAIVENAYDELMLIKALRASEIMKEETALLKLATENMPRLPVDDIDVLVVDRLGKNISGVGMDPNIIGRMMIRGEPEPERPRIKEIMVTDVTDESHGNALGIGLADSITQKLYDKIDFPVLYENVYTSTFLERAKVPVIGKHPRECMKYLLRACGPTGERGPKIVRIKDTLHLGEVYVSDAILQQIKDSKGVEVTMETAELFDDTGELGEF